MASTRSPAGKSPKVSTQADSLEKAAATSIRRPQRNKRKSRAETLVETRAKLMAAAAEIIGKVGYADCSIARVTDTAGVAHGTFYSYFESRQELFDLLLPELGEQMIAFISGRLKGAGSAAEVEERGLRAFLEFHEIVPGYHRILREAQAFAPKGYKRHIKNVTQGYIRMLERSWERGELPGYEKEEMEILAITFMAFRSYYGQRFVSGNKQVGKHEDAIRTYMKFVRGGLSYGSGKASGPSEKT